MESKNVQPHKKLCCLQKNVTSVPQCETCVCETCVTLMAGKVGEAEDISTNNFPKNHVILWYRSAGLRLPLRHASTLAKLQINSAEEPDKDSPNYHIAKLSTI